MFNMSAYYVPVEDEFPAQPLVRIPTDSSLAETFGHYLSQNRAFYTNVENDAQQARYEFLYRSDSVCMQGSGKLHDGRYINAYHQRIGMAARPPGSDFRGMLISIVM